jgi:hypothetical protein
MPLTCLLRRTYPAAALLAEHPPQLSNPHKQRVFDRLCPADAVHAGDLDVTRWAPLPLPSLASLSPTRIEPVPTVFDYAGPTDGVWHVNFADPHLFFGYGISLLAQDELQALEHPLLGPLREALLASGDAALTEEDGEPTPFLVANVERRGSFDSTGLYGPRFAAATTREIDAAITPLSPPPRSHLIAIAAPVSRGRHAYTVDDLALVLRTALTGFAAAVLESRRLWPAAPVELRTGFWGCGAFGGNRVVMTALQLLAARLAGADALRFHTVTPAGLPDFHAGAALLADFLAAAPPHETVTALLTRIAALDLRWGVGNGT